MIKLRKVYRFCMRPTSAQKYALSRLAGARRFIWNWGLARKHEHYKATGKTLHYVELSKEMTKLKSQAGFEWLREANAQSLQAALRDLDRAFVNFFEGRSRFPRFKSKKRDKDRFRAPQRVKVEQGKIYCPKVGWIRIRESRPVAEQTKSATFRRTADGKWYVSLVVEFEMPDVALLIPDPAKVVGIDLGLINYAMLSDGSVPSQAPRFFRKAHRALRHAQQKVSRRLKGSKRRAKAVKQVAITYQKIANRRSDFQHKLSTKIVHDFDGVCTEDLALKSLAKTKLAKSFADVGLGEFKRQLEYKCLWNRRHFVEVDRYFPSSRLCNVCGALNETLALSDREWDCDCGAHHNRDFLAACNIRDEGLRILAAGHAESLNARGDTVRPATAGSCR